MREYFYENMPSMANPLGLGHKSIPLVSKVQNLLIADFLHYLALRHNVYLSTMSGDIKKKKLHDEAVSYSGIIDPLAELDIDIQRLRHTAYRVGISGPGRCPLVDKGMVQQPGGR